jgi:hypothetical protein
MTNPAYTGSEVIHFNPKEFDVKEAKLVISGTKGKTEYTYNMTSENMTDHSFMSADTVNAIYDAKALLNKWRGEEGAQAQSVPESRK